MSARPTKGAGAATSARSVTSAPLHGLGVHGGRPCGLWLHREDGPLRFLSGGGTIPVGLAQVVDTRRCVVLGGDGGERVATVEHLLAALRVAGFWSGVLIEVDGPELPILDGSAAPFMAAIAELGPPPPAPPPLRLRAPFRWQEGQSELRLSPGEERLEVAIDFDHPGIGRQRWRGGPEDYGGLLDARTFALAREMAALQAAGLALGAQPGSGILFDQDGPQTPLRHPDEPVRHKALDALGDLSLLGRPLNAAIHIRRGSHRAHVLAMQQLLNTPGAIAP